MSTQTKSKQAYLEAVADFKKRQASFTQYIHSNKIRSRKALKKAKRKFGLTQVMHPDPADFK